MSYTAFVGGFVFNSHTEEFVKTNLICRDGGPQEDPLLPKPQINFVTLLKLAF